MRIIIFLTGLRLLLLSLPASICLVKHMHPRGYLYLKRKGKNEEKVGKNSDPFYVTLVISGDPSSISC
jgi:hypothetical protein